MLRLAIKLNHPTMVKRKYQLHNFVCKYINENEIDITETYRIKTRNYKIQILVSIIGKHFILFWANENLDARYDFRFRITNYKGEMIRDDNLQ